MADIFEYHSKGLQSPADIHFAIVPSDGADLPFVPRAIFCAASGNAVLRDRAGVDVTYQMTAGQILPFRPVRVLDTGTTATLVGWL